MNEKENNKTITPEQIESWKKKWGDVFCVTVGDKVAYLKRPSRQALSAAAVVGKNDPMKYNEILLNNCWLAMRKSRATILCFLAYLQSWVSWSKSRRLN